MYDELKGRNIMKEKGHLPLFGVGPMIVFGQYLITLIGIVAVFIMHWDFAKIGALKIPFIICGIVLIVFGFLLDYSAKMKSKLFENVKENKLITDGVYAIVRNPVYSGALLTCLGAVLIANNLLLLIVPVICWIYSTVFLIHIEEKWLKELYGQEYIDYCKKVNRSIPWFPRK